MKLMTVMAFCSCYPALCLLFFPVSGYGSVSIGSKRFLERVSLGT